MVKNYFYNLLKQYILYLKIIFRLVLFLIFLAFSSHFRIRLDYIFFCSTSIRLNLLIVVEPSSLTLRSLAADYPIFVFFTIPYLVKISPHNIYYYKLVDKALRNFPSIQNIFLDLIYTIMPIVSSILFPIAEAVEETIPRLFANCPDDTAKLFAVSLLNIKYKC